MKIRQLYKRLFAFALLGFLSLFYLGHLTAFIINGPVTVGESNKMILWVEVTVPWVDVLLANPPARDPWLLNSQTPRF